MAPSCSLLASHDGLPEERRGMKIQEKQGRAIYGVDMKIVDGDGNELPWDGNAFGRPDACAVPGWIVALQCRQRRSARWMPLAMVPHGRCGDHRCRRLSCRSPTAART
ncbi:hypothetical protein ACU4GD_38500 [Cupriavidus basilensis]